MWARYLFKIRNTGKHRPLINKDKFPWQKLMVTDDHILLIAYLPIEENLSDYWNDAFDIERDIRPGATFEEVYPWCLKDEEVL